MTRKVAITTLLSLLFSMGMGQGYDPARVGKKAANLYRQAMGMAEDGDFKGALVPIGQALAADPGFVDAWLSKAGLHGELKQYGESVKSYEKAFSLDKAYTREYRLPYAINLAGAGDFKSALKAVEEFSTIEGLNESSRKAAEFRIRCFRFAVEDIRSFKDTGYVFSPVNMGDSVNSEFSEYYPALTIAGDDLIFTRRVRGMNEDFFSSTRNPSGWSRAKLLEGDINSNLNEGAQTVSQDGEMLVFTGCDFPEGLGSCDLYYSIRTKQGWSQPRNMGRRINTEFWESAPALSPDKRELYFASSVPGGFGGIDIWVSTLQSNGQWSAPENLGPGINTPGNESCPFIHADNETLYFTSNGHPGYGGDDLYVSRRDKDGGWGTPRNLGYPINTIENEGSLVIASDGRTAYYASDREDSKGGLDIYTFPIREEVAPLRTLWVEGKVYDRKTGQGLPSAVELVDLADGRVASKVRTDEQGRYLVTLPIGRDYGFHVDRKGYLFHSGNFPFAQKTPDSTYRLDIPMQPIEKDANIVLKNIFYATNSFQLKPESASELDIIVRLMQENPTLRIRIDGHTDNTGKPADNMTLSNNRARSVVDYLTTKGIAKDRLTFKGFGSTKPIADNATEEGKAQNRRTELWVTAL
jgi:outer membrane protein OmpA-like peptidoglycan-associated protein